MKRRYGALALVMMGVARIAQGQDVPDQVNDPVWAGGAVNIGPANNVSQTIVPTIPCLTAVEVALKTGNRGRGGDRITLKVLDGNGHLLTSASADVQDGFEGYWRFTLAGGGIGVPPGQPLTLLLQDTSKNVFWWKYRDGNPYPRGLASFHGKSFADNDFYFRTYGKKSCQAKIPQMLSGYVDMHAHPMSYLGFGRKAVHGAPDIGAIIPAGTRDCNPVERRAVSRDDALGHCNATHGGWGVDNTCGDYIRAAIINFGIDNDFANKTSNAHGDHAHPGSPGFLYWPHQTSKTHQQMWWEWVKRARDGGLRVMVALAVNSELLAEILNGDRPYDDMTVANLQIDETVRFVNNHRDFMEVAYSSADVRRIVGQGKLAVVLGIEVDQLGNFGKPGVRFDPVAVRAEIQRLHGKGVRYVFPVHLIDNVFGGSAVYDMMFSFANKRANGRHYLIGHSVDSLITYNAAALKGFEDVAITSLRATLEGIGQLPAPCFNDLFKCSPPPGKVVCCGSYQNIVNAFAPSLDLEVYKVIPPGHVNALGLTPLGETAIREMMRLGMMIDVDHMSERSMTRAIEIAEGIPGYYPLMMGHNGLRERKSNGDTNERSAPAALLGRMAKLGGILGVGTADITAKEFVANYESAWRAMGKGSVGIGIGTDVNGMERLPRRGGANDPSASDAFYRDFFRNSPVITSRQITGTRTWDYVRDGGVSHYGLLPEFIYDVRIQRKGQGDEGEEVYNHLMQSADQFALSWERCEAAAARVPPGQ
jgi:microsomal dipeptidase-like Zn-dependent dipeptidase